VKISICIPIIGREKQFSDLLCSILMQNYDDLELVVADGDPLHHVRGDLQITRLFEIFGDQVKYEAKYDAGILYAVNDCLRRATGDILYLACSDDLLCPGALATVNDAFVAERFGGPFWLYGQTISADVLGRTLGIDGKPTTFDEMLVHNRIGQPAVFWNRNMMEIAGMFDPRYRYAADYDLWIRFWKQREPMFIGQTLGIHRHHDGQATRVHAWEVAKEAAKISWRHRCLNSEVTRARNLLQSKRHYVLNGAPESVN
jgi:glycosyltransferase involved in cell wall biosynthesis